MIKIDNLKDFNVNFNDINWLYDFLKNLFFKIDKEKISKKIDEMKKKYSMEQKKDLAARLINDKARWSSASGGASSLPGCIPGLGTAVEVGSVTLDLLNWLRMQTVLVLEIACLYNFNINTDERILDVLIILGEATGLSSFVNELKEQIAGRKATKPMLTTAKDLAWMIGCHLLKRNIIRFIPIIGIFASASRNYKTTKAVGKEAISFYEKKSLSR